MPHLGLYVAAHRRVEGFDHGIDIVHRAFAKVCDTGRQIICLPAREPGVGQVGEEDDRHSGPGLHEPFGQIESVGSGAELYVHNDTVGIERLEGPHGIRCRACSHDLEPPRLERRTHQLPKQGLVLDHEDRSCKVRLLDGVHWLTDPGWRSVRLNCYRIPNTMEQ